MRARGPRDQRDADQAVPRGKPDRRSPIGAAGAVGLGEGLTANAALTTLNLNRNKIGAAGAVGLGEGLAANAALTELDLSSNEIGDASAVGLSEGLATNAALTTLDHGNLRNNQIDDVG